MTNAIPSDDLRAALLSLRRSVGASRQPFDSRRAATLAILADARARIDRINAAA